MISLPVMSAQTVPQGLDLGAVYTTSQHEDRLQREPEALMDRWGRRIDHLRLSVTSSCNLRCSYCRPAAATASSPRQPALTDRQRLDLIQFFAARYGLRQLRITGGEPLLHRTLISLVESIRSKVPSLEIAMTTNGQCLTQYARGLRSAGLDRLNISLDTLSPQRYRLLTGGELQPVLDGIHSALGKGFSPKLNVVVLRGINDDEIPGLVSWAFSLGLEIRFLEAMPIGPAAEFNRAHYLSAREIRKALDTVFRLRPLPRHLGETAARYTAENDACSGSLGIIAPISESFCSQCRRVRVTADGKLFPCLLDSRHVDLSPCWRGEAFSARRANHLILSAVSKKQQVGPLRQDTAMVSLGG
jgi:GTP 3',8-cyclase